jgi:hypothetical protein
MLLPIGYATLEFCGIVITTADPELDIIILPASANTVV